jgi:hypothetical protein
MMIALNVYSDGSRHICEMTADQRTVLRDIEGVNKPGARVSVFVDIGYDDQSPDALAEVLRALADLQRIVRI